MGLFLHVILFHIGKIYYHLQDKKKYVKFPFKRFTQTQTVTMSINNKKEFTCVINLLRIAKFAPIQEPVFIPKASTTANFFDRNSLCFIHINIDYQHK